jgi:uncharacterized paraquat-inducible protein A
MKSGKKLKTCSRGHQFQKSSDYPVCLKCWPGYYLRHPDKKRENRLLKN